MICSILFLYLQLNCKYKSKMLLNFSIKNFGCFKDEQTLSMEANRHTNLEKWYVRHYRTNSGKTYRVLKLALLYGANASGKTTVLKALDFLRELVLEPAEKKTEELDFTPFLFNKNTPNENSGLKIEFLQNGIKYLYELEFNQKAIVSEKLHVYNPNRAKVYIRETDLETEYTVIKFGGKIKIGKTESQMLTANTLWNHTVLGGYLKTNIEIQELKEVTDWFKNFLYRLVQPRSILTVFITKLLDKGKIRKDILLNILKAADFNISDINIKKEVKPLPEEFLDFLKLAGKIDSEKFKEIENVDKITGTEIFFQHKVSGENYVLPFELESQGTQRFYGLAGFLDLLIRKNILVPFDELESSIHPDLFRFFLLSFLVNAQNSQIIATTHNREILDEKDLIRDDALWITDKTEEGYSELYSFADFDTSVLRKGNNRLNIYKAGRLGGIPRLVNYFSKDI